MSFARLMSFHNFGHLKTKIAILVWIIITNLEYASLIMSFFTYFEIIKINLEYAINNRRDRVEFV